MNRQAQESHEQLIAALNRHDAEAAVERFAEDVLFWEPSYDEPRRGRDAIRREFEGFFAMLPDIQFTPETLVIEGQHAVSEWTYRATYEGRPVVLRECSISRIDTDGRMAEVRVYFDRLTLLRQLGITPEG